MPRHSPCALSTLTSIQTPNRSRRSSDAVFPWCAVRARGSFRQPRPRLTSTAHIKQLDISHCPCGLWPAMPAFASPPVLRRGRAGALLDGFYSSSSKLWNFQRTCAVISRDARGSCSILVDRSVVSLQEVEDTGIEPVTSSLQSWRSPS